MTNRSIAMRRAAGRVACLVVATLIAACSAGASPATPGATSAASVQPSAGAPTRGAATPRPTSTLPPGVSSLAVDFRPSGIVAAGDVIWAEDHARTGGVYAIDGSTGQTIAELDLARPCDLALGFDRLWVPDLDRGTLLSIDLETGKVAAEIPGLSGPCGPQIVGDEVWVAVDAGLARVDPATLDVSLVEFGHALFPGVGEPIWAVDFGTGEHVRLDPGTGEIRTSIQAPGGASEFPPPAAGHGSLWVANSAAEAVYRLDPMTGELLATITTAPATRLLVTPAAVWLTSYETGLVQRLDPETNTVTLSIELGGSPNGIAPGDGAVWVADTARGRILRIDPPDG